MFRFPIVFVAVLSTSLLSSALPLMAAETTSTATARITIVCSRPDIVANRDLRVLQQAEDDRDRFDPISLEAKLDAAGQCTIMLAPASYRFEVLATDADRVIALRSPSVAVDGAKTVTLVGEDPKPVSLSLDEKAFSINQIGIRSAGSADEIRWIRPPTRPDSVPQVVLSPQESYRLCLIGHNAADHVAIWTPLPTDHKADFAVTAKELYTCRIRVRDGTPTSRSITAIQKDLPAIQRAIQRQSPAPSN